jgi:hypothetical protein
MQAEYFALEGISELLDTVERIRAALNPQLSIEGVVLTMLDDRTSLAKQVMAELKRYFGEKLCTTAIPRNIRLAEAPSHGKPALLYDVRSRGAESYIRLAKEIIANYFAEATAGESQGAPIEAAIEPPEATAESVTGAEQAPAAASPDKAAVEAHDPASANGEPQGAAVAGDSEAPAAEGGAAVEEMGKTA